MRAIAVQGMAFGDEGKGATVDWLTRQHGAPLVVRYNGGPNAAHNVVTPEGQQHTFSQFGSGTLAQGPSGVSPDTHLSRYALLDPLTLELEVAELKPKIQADPYAFLTVDPDAVVITRYHVAANRAREAARGAGRHGSVGAGLGEAREDQLAGVFVTARLAHRGGDPLVKALREIRNRKLNSLAEEFEVGSLSSAEEEWEQATGGLELEQIAEELTEAMRPVRIAVFAQAWRRALNLRSIWHEGSTVIFEGSQGVLLDERAGFAPYTSWTDCTFRNADRVLDDYRLPEESRHRLGVFRSYFTRHGPGPFPTENVAAAFHEEHNGAHPWMGQFRRGWFDGALAALAVTYAAPDALVVTHMDRWRPGQPCCQRYEGATARDGVPGSRPTYCHPENFLGWLSARVGKSVEVISRGPTHEDFEETVGAPLLSRAAAV